MNSFWISWLPAALRRKIEGRANLQKVITNIGWLSIDKIFRMGAGLIVGIWIARYLGPDNFGIYSYAIAFVSLFGIIAGLGFESIVVRELVETPEKRGRILGTTLVLRLGASVLCLGIAWAVISFIKPQDLLMHAMVLILGTGVIAQSFDTIDLLFQAEIRSQYIIYARSAAFLLASLGRIALILLKAPLIDFAWAALAETLTASLGVVLVFWLKGHRLLAWRPDLYLARDLLKDSWAILISNAVILIYMRVDQIMLGSMVSNHEVGVYSSAVKLAEVWNFIPMSILASVFPVIIKAKTVSEELFYQRLQKFYNLMAFVGYLLAILVTFTAGWAIHLLFGPAYARAAPMLVVLIWAGLFTNLGVARSSFLMAMNWTKFYLVSVVAGCLINIALNLWLIPLYGGLGAAVASLVAYWLVSHGACFLYRPMHKTGYMLTRAMLFPRFW